MLDLLRKFKKPSLIMIVIGLAIALLIKENSVLKLFSASFFIGAGVVLLIISNVRMKNKE